jgi:hypothetical protein
VFFPEEISPFEVLPFGHIVASPTVKYFRAIACARQNAAIRVASNRREFRRVNTTDRLVARLRAAHILYRVI